jgi:rhodanese-related sulfurtransferase
MDASLSRLDLARVICATDPDQRPIVIDVRRAAAYIASPDTIAGALRRDPQTVADWLPELPRSATVVVYCVHGHEVSQGVARALRDGGLNARFLGEGLEGWRQSGGALAPKPVGASTRWVTRERPKIDRIACPWLIARFIDRDAEFLYVPAPEVRSVAVAQTATAYDIPDVAFSHVGELCSFDALVRYFGLTSDPALTQLATIIRGADTGRLELAPQAPGLLAASLGLSRLFQDDHEMLKHGMVLYDALYRWCKEGQDEIHTWNPVAYR